MPCFYCWELIFCLISGFCGYHLMEKNAAGPWRITYNDVRKAINSNCTIHAFCALKVPKTLVFLKYLNQFEIFFFFCNFLSHPAACSLLCNFVGLLAACNSWWWDEASSLPRVSRECLCKAPWQHMQLKDQGMLLMGGTAHLCNQLCKLQSINKEPKHLVSSLEMNLKTWNLISLQES